MCTLFYLIAFKLQFPILMYHFFIYHIVNHASRLIHVHCTIAHLAIVQCYAVHVSPRVPRGSKTGRLSAENQ